MTGDATKPWPYCEGHPHCHDSRTRHYAQVGTTGTGLYWPSSNTLTSADEALPFSNVHIASGSGPQDPRWGQRLCRAHAFILWRCA